MEHIMRLDDEYFQEMKSGKKKVEIRLYDEKRRLINIGDTIIFKKLSNEDKYLKGIVTDLKIYDTFSELIDNNDINELGKDTDTKESLLNILSMFYSKEEEEKYKVVAIRLQLREKSCGIVVFSNNKVLLVHHNNGHWGMPKGHVELGETEEETAIREVLEETNINSKIIPGFKEVITYSPKENTMKDVVYFIGEPIDNNLKPQEEEVNEVKFVSVEDAVNLITYKEDKSVFEKALKYYKK